MSNESLCKSSMSIEQDYLDKSYESESNPFNKSLNETHDDSNHNHRHKNKSSKKPSKKRSAYRRDSAITMKSNVLDSTRDGNLDHTINDADITFNKSINFHDDMNSSFASHAKPAKKMKKSHDRDHKTPISSRKLPRDNNIFIFGNASDHMEKKPLPNKQRRQSANILQAVAIGLGIVKKYEGLSKIQMRSISLEQLDEHISEVKIAMDNIPLACRSDTIDTRCKLETILKSFQSAFHAQKANSQANEFYKSQNYAEAINYYSIAITHDSSSASYFANRAAAYMMLEKYALAVHDTEKAIELEPHHIRAYIRLASAHLSLGNSKYAQNTLSMLVDMNRKGIEIKESFKKEADEIAIKITKYNENLDNCGKFLCVENASKVDGCLSKLLEVAPSSLRVRSLQLCNSLVKLRISASANTFFLEHNISASSEKTLRLTKDYLFDGMAKLCPKRQDMIEEMIWLGCALASITFFPEAIKCFRAALEIGGENSVANFCLSFAQAISDITVQSTRSMLSIPKDAFGAISMIDRAINLAVPTLIDASVLKGRLYYERAGIYFSIGNYASSINDCTTALKFLPSFNHALVKRAKSNISFGTLQSLNAALKDLEAAEVKQSMISSVMEKIAELEKQYNSNKEKDAARQTWQARRNFFHNNNTNPSENKENEKGSNNRRASRGKTPKKENHESYKSKTQNFPETSVGDKKGMYGILGLKPTASKDEIRKAYRSKALKYHPDKNRSPNAEAIFKAIGEAYQVLSSPTKRQAYDCL